MEQLTGFIEGHISMPEIHLRQTWFTYSACRPFTKIKRRIQKFKEARDLQYICQNEVDKACFQHGIAYGDFKYLARRATSDKILRDKAFNIAKISNYDGYPRGLPSTVYKFFAENFFALNARSETLPTWATQ